MTSPAVQRSTWTTDPAAYALRTMGETARAAADTWTVQEWAGKLAARAAPRDYAGQLRALYDDVMHRWRYVQEEGERVPGSPRALLGHVLGAWYNAGPHCTDPEHCDVERTPWQQRGFGDCDDVSTLLAAGALAMGMQPKFRVARWPGGAHVSTFVTTPKGEAINLDPVGEPEHGFGWAMEPSGGDVMLVDMEGRSTAALGGIVQPHIVQPLAGESFSVAPTYMSGLGEPQVIESPHVVLTRPGDTRGARVLVIPTWHYRLIARGLVEDGMPAVDQYGDVYQYMAGADVWAPIGCCGVSPMGRRRRRWKFGRRLRKLGRRIARRVAKVGRSRIVKAIRKGAGRLLRSKLVQEAAAKGMQALGVPPQATKAILAREGELARRGGRAKIAELLAEGKRGEAAKLIAQATGVGLRAGVGMGSYYAEALAGAEVDDENGIEFVLVENGREYPVAPVAGFERVGGWYGFGQLDVADTPTPGRYYRIKKGDTFFKNITQAYGIGAGQARLAKAREVNNIAYNQRFHGPAPAGEKGYWKNDGNTRISYMPSFSCDAEEQALADGGSGSCYAIVYFPVAGEEPPPYEKPQPPPEPELPELPDEPEEPTVVIPEEPEEPEEPDTPVLPPEPPELPEEPKTPAPPVEPKPPEPSPPEPEPPAEPEIEEPETPGMLTCPPGYRADPVTGTCVPMCPEGYTYDAATNTCRSAKAPECPPGYTFIPSINQCAPTHVPTPTVVDEPEPTVIECPPGTMWDDKSGFCRQYDVPVQPQPQAPSAPSGGAPWALLLIASVASGSPLPLVAAAFMEKRK